METSRDSEWKRGREKKKTALADWQLKSAAALFLLFLLLHAVFFFKEIDWKLQPLESTELIGLPVKSNTFLFFFSYVCVCFRAQHLLVVTDSGKSQHRIRLNCGGEKGVRGGKERGLSIIWKLCGIFSILCTHWSLSCLPTGRRTAGGLLTSLAKYLSVPTVTIGLLTRGSDSRGREFYIVSPPSQWREYLRPPQNITAGL